MKKRDIALYKLADAAVSGNLADASFASVDDAAARLGVSRSTAGRAIQRLLEVGTARWMPGSGELMLCSRSRAVDVYKTVWTRKDALVGTTTAEHAKELVRNGEAVWGGCVAAANYMDGLVAARPHGLSIYIPLNTACDLRGGDVSVYRWMDNDLPASGFSTVTQTLAELFNTPGWAADEFYRELWDRKVALR